MPLYFYAFTPHQFDELTLQGTAFERGYLDSHTFFEQKIECARPAVTFHNGEVLPTTPHIFHSMMNQFRVYLTGRMLTIGESSFYILTQPWKCIVEIAPEERAGLVPYEGELPEYFYRKKIGLFGGPGSGKSCLARELTNYLCINMGIAADNAYEAVTTFIAKYGPPTFPDEIWLMLQQWEREEDISRTKQVMVSDCPHPLGYVYSKQMAASSKVGTHRSLPWIYEMALKGLDSFGSKVFLPFRGEYVTEDGIRLHNPEESKRIAALVKGFLEETGSQYTVYDGSVENLAKSLFFLNLACPCADNS